MILGSRSTIQSKTKIFYCLYDVSHDLVQSRRCGPRRLGVSFYYEKGLHIYLLSSQLQLAYQQPMMSENI